MTVNKKTPEKQSPQTACRRCGTCCQNGGPALHGPDLPLVRQGKLSLDALITIRRGELAHNPLTDRIESIPYELVKIRGTGREWCCCYYDAARKGCSIYGNRPVACGTLKCWQPKETLALVGQDLLSRLDILGEAHPWRAVVLEYERLCPCPDMGEVHNKLMDQQYSILSTLEIQISTDLAFRERVVSDLNLSLDEELFLFGRPLFQLLQGIAGGIQ